MASRCRTISKPAMSFLKSAISKPSSRPMFAAQSTRVSASPFSRSLPQMAMLQSLLPLHSALSAARLTSCLGIDTKGCRSLSQELGQSVPRRVRRGNKD